MSIVEVFHDESIRDYRDEEQIYRIITDVLDRFLKRSFHDIERKALFKRGTKIVIKPNLVHELNFRVRFEHEKMDNPNDCFITSWTIIKALVRYLGKYDGLIIKIVECPLQSCEIEKIVTEEMLDGLKRYNEKNDIEFIDSRRTKYVYTDHEPKIYHNLRDESLYVDFDLKRYSLHHDFEQYADRFRVTDYPPKEMKKFHSKGRHIYRIAKEMIEADLIFNVPKLKTHMKSGMTGAMKNFVGAVGNKECLPHHIKGTPLTGGDCHGDVSIMKKIMEDIFDIANAYLLEDEKKYYNIAKIARGIKLLRQLVCLDDDVSGSWYGNDTICRTIVDLNRCLYYGDVTGKFHRKPQRKIISVVDAIVSGMGNGPMCPIPNNTGIVAVSDSTAAADMVCAEMIGLDSTKIKYLANNRIEHALFPLIDGQLCIKVNGVDTPVETLHEIKRNIVVPPRWGGHINKQADDRFTYFNKIIKDMKGYPQMILKNLKKLF